MGLINESGMGSVCFALLLLYELNQTISFKCVWGRPVEKQMMVPLSINQMDGVSLQNAVVALLVKRALDFE